MNATYDRPTSINQEFYHCAEQGSARDMLHANWVFHIHIAKLSSNPYLVTYTDQLMVQAHRNEIRFFETHTHFEQRHRSHEKIIDALRCKGIEHARRIIRSNWQISSER